MNLPRQVAYYALVEGITCEHKYRVTDAVYSHFLAAFDDRSPIHVDAAYARARGFAGCVMHGGILNGFMSHFIGMVFPGASSLLLSLEVRFLDPVYLGDVLELRAKVSQRLESHQVIVLQIVCMNETRGTRAATARAQVKVRES